jgi:hypothetical protein
MGVIDHIKGVVRKGDSLGEVVGNDALACGDEINISPSRMKAIATTEIEKFHRYPSVLCEKN